MSLKKRTAVLKEWKNAGPDGPLVLIMSAVGNMGLNLPFGNHIIAIVSDTDITLRHQQAGTVYRAAKY